MFIGYYSLANGVTLAGLLFSVLSCMLAAHTGHIEYCIYLMFLSFLCDIFDGRLARMKKNRSASAKLFGIQLDSLCDLVSFGITPCFIAYFAGYNGPFDVFIYCLVVACGAIRLSYFNTLAINDPKKAKEGYRGLPIPASMIVITFLFMLKAINMPESALSVIFKLAFIGMGLGFILNFKVKKSGLKGTLILIIVEVLMLLILLFNGISYDTDNNDGGAETEVSETSLQTSNETPIDESSESSDISTESSVAVSDSSDISINSSEQVSE